MTNLALAGDHTLNARSRASWSHIDNDITQTGLPSSSSFQIDYLNLTFAGNLSPTVKYEIMTDFLESNPNSTPDTVNGTTQFIEEAFFVKKFSQGTSVTFGKMPINFGGIEYSYPEYDLYAPSAFWNSIPSNDVGLMLSHDFFDQNISLQYFNGNKENGSAANPPINQQSKFGYSAFYHGSFLNGMIVPILGYTVIPKGVITNLRNNKGDDVYLAGGIQLNSPHNFTLELEYDNYSSQNAGAAKENLDTSSMVGVLRYSFQNVSPFFKYIKDDVKTLSISELNSSYDFGVDVKENSESTFKYFAHYLYKDSENRLNSKKSKPQMMALGVVFDSAILK